jgi:pimeloyl-ACP methyl ester carboxylesterase
MLSTLARSLVRTLPAPLALQVVTGLATRTQRPAVHVSQQPAMAAAHRLSYGPRRQHVAWTWTAAPGHTSPPLVVLVHGWNGRAAQMAPLAAHLAGLGFHCVALDVTGHGDSPGQRTAWRLFMHDLAALMATLAQPAHALVGHSAGGLAAMAARGVVGVQAQRYVAICAPSHPFPPVRAVRERLDPPPAVIERYQAHLARQFGTDWSTLQHGQAWSGAGHELLLYYDEADRYVDHREGDRIQAWCPGATLIKSRDQGHSRVLSSPDLHQAVGRFLMRPTA